MARFKYWLDSQLLTTEPMGVDSVEIIIERDEELRGLFTNYMTNLKFYLDGYGIILNKLKTEGACSFVEFRVESQQYDFGSYDLLYAGRINIVDCDFNLDECFVTCQVEDAYLSTYLKKNKDAKVTLGLEKTADGSTQPAIDQLCNFHNVDTGIYDWTNRTVYFVKDALDYVVRYLTNNGLIVTSTYLTAGTTWQYAEWEIDFFNGLANGDQVTINYVDAYSTTRSKIRTKSAASRTTSEMFVEFIRNYDMPGAGFDADGNAYMDTSFIYGRELDCAGNVSATKMILRGWTEKVSITSVSVGGGPTPAYNPTVTQCQAFAFDGAYPFVIANMRRVISDIHRPVITSFKELLQGLTGAFGIAYRFTTIAGQPTMVVEHINDLYGTPPSITLTGVRVTSVSIAEKGLYKGVSVGEENYAEERMFRPETWICTDCYGDNLEASRPLAATARYTTNDQQDQNIIVHVEPDGSDWKTVIHNEIVRINNTAVPGAFDLKDRYWFNAPLVNYFCVKRNQFLVSSDLKKDGLTIEKDASEPNLALEYQFEHQLTCQQIQAIKNNPTSPIAFNGEIGWIESVKIDIDSKIAKFVLLSELNL